VLSSYICFGPEKGLCFLVLSKYDDLLGARVLGHCLGSLADGVLSEFTREQQTNSGLDFPAGDGRSLVVVGKARSFGSDSFEDVVDEAVHDAHSLGADSGIGVNLLQNLVDVDGVRFLPPLLLLLLIGLGDVFLGLARFLRSFSRRSRRHCDKSTITVRDLQVAFIQSALSFRAEQSSANPYCAVIGR